MQAAEGPWYRGLTRYQWLVLLVAWLGWVFDIADSAVYNFTKIPALKEILGSAEYARIGSTIEGAIPTWFLTGWSIGGLLFGILADRWGRTRTLVVTVLLYSLLTALTVFVHTVPQFMAVRFLTGIGIGGEWAAGAALIAEVFPNKARAPAASLLQSAAAFGPILAAFANQALASAPWRWMYLLGAAPALITVFIRLFAPEPENSKKAEARSDAGSLKALFGHPVWRRNAIIAIVIGLVGIAGANNFSLWIPNFVKAASGGLAEDVVRVRTSDVTYFQHAGTLLGVFAFPWLCQKIGRKLSFGIFFGLAPLALAIPAFGGVTFNSLLWQAPLLSFVIIGLSAGYPLYLPELFPTHLRATGSGLAYNVGRIGTVPVPLLTGMLIGEMNGSPAKGVLVAGLIYVIGLAVIPFAPETKGLPLPEDAPLVGEEPVPAR